MDFTLSIKDIMSLIGLAESLVSSFFTLINVVARITPRHLGSRFAMGGCE